MNNVQDLLNGATFHEHDLVTWHYRNGSKYTPIPAVVVRQEMAGVLIRARVDGTVKELYVTPNQIDHR
jgi:multidrug efflux pump subunit AcrA (membrane-fusion protein)